MASEVARPPPSGAITEYPLAVMMYLCCGSCRSLYSVKRASGWVGELKFGAGRKTNPESPMPPTATRRPKCVHNVNWPGKGMRPGGVNGGNPPLGAAHPANWMSNKLAIHRVIDRCCRI